MSFDPPFEEARTGEGAVASAAAAAIHTRRRLVFRCTGQNHSWTFGTYDALDLSLGLEIQH